MSDKPARSIEFGPNAFADLIYWIETDPKLAQRLTRMIDEATRTPFTGIGKPEPLKGEWRGSWSRRINDEHRLTYSVSDERIRVIGCRFHYGRR